MQARFFRIAELIESIGLQSIGMPHVRLAQRQVVGNSHERARWQY
jgi:hypothetical protein